MTVRKNWLEWCVFAVGLALVLAITGYLAVQAVYHEYSPPRLGVRIEQVWRAADVEPPHFVVPVTVTNHGGRTASEVIVEVTLVRDGTLLERNELRLSEVPRRSSRGAASTMQQRPAPEELRARIVGYGEP